MRFFVKLLFLVAAIKVLNAADVRMDQLEKSNHQRELERGLQNSDLKLREEEQVPEVIPGDRDDMGPQYVLKQKNTRKWWELTLNTQSFYTSNMLQQSDRYATDTTVLASTATFSIYPAPLVLENGDRIDTGIGFRQTWINYGLGDNGKMFRYQDDIPTDDPDGYNKFDFDAQTIRAGAYYYLGKDWVFELSFDFTRLMGHEVSHTFPQSSNYSEFYKEYVPTWAVARLFEITPVTKAVIAYTGKLRYTDSENAFTEDQTDGTNRRDINNRLDSILDFSLNHQIVPTLFVQPFFRFQYSNYNMNENRNDLSYKDREDFTYTYGAALSWQVNDWFQVGTFGNWEKRKSSSNRVDEYSKFDLGGGLNAVIRF